VGQAACAALAYCLVFDGREAPKSAAPRISTACALLIRRGAPLRLAQPCRATGRAGLRRVAPGAAREPARRGRSAGSAVTRVGSAPWPRDPCDGGQRRACFTAVRSEGLGSPLA
jgi:hypothetical protein